MRLFSRHDGFWSTADFVLVFPAICQAYRSWSDKDQDLRDRRSEDCRGHGQGIGHS